MRAILSVYDKSGVVEFGQALSAAGIELVSTGGTFAELQSAGMPVTSVSDVTGFPEIMDGRVKTLHPGIHGGILARKDMPGDLDQLCEHGIGTVDLVAVNLYPFTETIARPGVQLAEALENIDIGGPTMVRAAAKNHPHVVVVVDPPDYGWLAERIGEGGVSAVTAQERRALATKAFAHVSTYDAAIAGYLGDSQIEAEGPLPETVTLSAQRIAELRYGENPHQAAGLYADTAAGGVANAEQLHGKALSFNNLLDADAAWRVVSDFEGGAVAVIKHNNPCGLAAGDDQTTTYGRAFEGDPVSAYGGIVGFNRTVTGATAKAMKGVFYEVVVAPGYDPDALDILTSRKNLRILAVSSGAAGASPLEVRRISGGVLVQGPDELIENTDDWKVVTSLAPTDAQMADLAFAWKAVKHVKSNAIVLAADQALRGMGAGQPNRLNSIHLAVRAAGDRAAGSVLASDAFFPFADNIDMAAEAGVVALVQPGGSIRDEDVIEAADRLGLAMVFTGVRHFRH
jgi:phosphoribosylaminoimidazolecarboxamide formyltransferase/IMP cyclohydrolase